jgi:hypothetical protein
MRTIICGGSLIVTGAGVVFLLTLAAHSFGSPLPGAGLGQEAIRSRNQLTYRLRAPVQEVAQTLQSDLPYRLLPEE